MNTYLKRLFSLLMCMCLVLGMIPGVAFAAETEETEELVTSGSCGENVFWNYNPETKTLVISGTGEIKDGARLGPTMMGSPTYWETREYYRVMESVETLIIQEGITSIGLRAFAGGINIVSIVLPKSLNEIGEMAFCYAGKLLSVDLPERLFSVEQQAFLGCRKLNKITVRSDIKFGSGVFSNCPNIRNIVFTGSAPSLGYSSSANETSAVDVSIFSANVQANAYYPTNKKWTQQDFQKNYGGNLNWISYTDAAPDIPAEEIFEQDSGTFGSDKLQWHFDEATGILTISGTGKSGAFLPNMHPWGDWRQKIKKLLLKKVLHPSDAICSAMITAWNL